MDPFNSFEEKSFGNVSPETQKKEEIKGDMSSFKMQSLLEEAIKLLEEVKNIGANKPIQPLNLKTENQITDTATLTDSKIENVTKGQDLTLKNQSTFDENKFSDLRRESELLLARLKKELNEKKSETTPSIFSEKLIEKSSFKPQSNLDKIVKKFDSVNEYVEKIYKNIGSKEGIEKFKDQLNNCILGFDENTPLNQIMVRGYNGESIGMMTFLEGAEELSSKSGYIENCFIDNALLKLINSKSNKDTACYNTIAYGINMKDKNNPIQYYNSMLGTIRKQESLDFEDVKKVLIPVNVDGEHWMLYCFDNTGSNPTLYRVDSFVQDTRKHITQSKDEIKNEWINEIAIPTWVDNNDLRILQKLEDKIVDELKKDFGLGDSFKIDRKEAKVIQQCNNTCGVHVCKNAEWFMEKDLKWNPNNLTSEKFHDFRLELLLNFLTPSI